MNRLLIIVILVFAASIAEHPRPVDACSCIGISVDTAYTRATAVFLGRVVKCELKNTYTDAGTAPFIRRAGEYKLATLEVLKLWKGTLDSLVQVRTAPYSGLCGVDFNVPEVYLVYALEYQDHKLSTNICARSTHQAYAEGDIQELNKKYSR